LLGDVVDIFNPTENDVYENSESTFPAYRYWKDGELLGDNFDIYISVVYGDPEVLGVTQAEDYWIAVITKEGVVQEKKFFSEDYVLSEGETPPFSDYPRKTSEYLEVFPNTQENNIEDSTTDGIVQDVIASPLEQTEVPDQGDVVVGVGEGDQVDYGVPLETLNNNEEEQEYTEY